MLRLYTASVPKEGLEEEENEDALRVASFAKEGEIVGAIADGATESAQAAKWSQAICDHLLASHGREAVFTAGLSTLRQKWQRDTTSRSEELPWFVERKRREGDYAAFRGLTIAKDTWSTFGCGDCLLFRISSGYPHQWFPGHLDSESILERPLLLSSDALAISPRLDVDSGELRLGDEFVLCTDALAAWILWRLDLGETPFAILKEALEQDRFLSLISDLRQSKNMKNDDTSVVWICPTST